MKIDPLFGLFIIVFVAADLVLIKDFEIQKTNDLKSFSNSIAGIVKGKNDVINNLSSQLVLQENENQDLRNTLSDTRNKLELLTKNLATLNSPFTVCNWKQRRMRLFIEFRTEIYSN